MFILHDFLNEILKTMTRHWLYSWYIYFIAQTNVNSKLSLFFATIVGEKGEKNESNNEKDLKKYHILLFQ